MVHCDTCISVLLSKCYRTKPTKLSAIFFEFWIEVADVQEQISFSENSKNIYLRDIIRYHPVAKYMIDLQSQLVGPRARCLLRPLLPRLQLKHEHITTMYMTELVCDWSM